MDIRYKYHSWNILWFINNEGYGSTTRLSLFISFPEKYYNVFIHPFVNPHFLGRYFNVCNAIYNHNMMRQSGLLLDKYWVTQSGYFRLATAVALGMGITYGELLYFHGIAEEMRKIKFQHWSKITVQFMTYSIIPF